MSRQLIFCVESDNRAKTDWIYLKSVIDQFYTYGNEIKLSPVYMAGKMNYRRPKVLNTIKTLKQQYSGETSVIYCIDTDAINTDMDRKREFEEIAQYCKKKRL